MTWAFKCKWYPYVLTKKFKDQFFTQGDQHIEVIDFVETYAPVVQWKTVLFVIIFGVLLGLKSKQGDVTDDFIHADIGEDEKVYVNM